MSNPSAYRYALAMVAGLSPVVAEAAGERLEGRVIADDPAFHELVAEDAELVRLYSDARWSEGPLALPDGRLIWSDIENNRVLSWREDEGVDARWLRPAQFHNGHALDHQGRILAASHGKRAIERLEENGEWRVLVDLYGEQKLNSPNDLVVDRQGAIWFTDPTFGIDSPTEGYGGRAVQGGEYVYRFDPKDERLTRLDTPAVQTPNGLAFSPDEGILYIADSRRSGPDGEEPLQRIFAYDLGDDGSLVNERVFTEVSPGAPDGIKVDEHGNVWSSSGSGVQVFAPDGRRLGRIELPEITANLAFAKEADGWKVYMTATSGLYRVDVETAAAGGE